MSNSRDVRLTKISNDKLIDLLIERLDDFEDDELDELGHAVEFEIWDRQARLNQLEENGLTDLYYRESDDGITDGEDG